MKFLNIVLTLVLGFYLQHASAGGKGASVRVINDDSVSHSVQLVYGAQWSKPVGEWVLLQPGEENMEKVFSNDFYGGLYILVDFEEITSGDIPKVVGDDQFILSLKCSRGVCGSGQVFNGKSKSGNMSVRYGIPIIIGSQETQEISGHAMELMAGPKRIVTSDSMNERLDESQKEIKELKKKLDIVENQQDDLINKKFDEDVKSPDSAINAMIQSYVKEELTIEQLTEAVGKSLEEAREKHATDSMLPTGTFYISKVGYTDKGDFVITPANEQVSTCGDSYPKSYYVTKNTPNSHQLAAQALSAFVMDGRLKVELWKNRVDLGVCEILAASVSNG